MTMGSGINTSVRIKEQASGMGVAAGATDAQELRRTECVLDPQRPNYRSNEKVIHGMPVDMRLGAKSGTGQLSGILAPGSYKIPMKCALRGEWVAGVTTGVLTVIAAASGKFVLSTGSWITKGFRVGDIFRPSGFTAGGVGNNGKNFRVTGVTATDLSVAETVAVKAEGDSVTIAVVGSKLFRSSTAPTDPWVSVEKWHEDVEASTLAEDAKVGGMNMNLPAEGLATVQFPLLYRNHITDDEEYFTSPTVPGTDRLIAAVSGVLRFNGVDIATITGITLAETNNLTPFPGVVGSDMIPGISQGASALTGTITAGFESHALHDLFWAETEFEIHLMLTTTEATNSAFISAYMGRAKFTGNQTPDPDGPIIQSLPFEALLCDRGSAYDKSFMVIQDSSIT